jgi:hypothetical protein
MYKSYLTFDCHFSRGGWSNIPTHQHPPTPTTTPTHTHGGDWIGLTNPISNCLVGIDKEAEEYLCDWNCFQTWGIRVGCRLECMTKQRKHSSRGLIAPETCDHFGQSCAIIGKALNTVQHHSGNNGKATHPYKSATMHFANQALLSWFKRHLQAKWKQCIYFIGC